MPDELARRGWSVEIHDDHFDRSASDEEWLTEVSRRGWVTVTQDTKMRYRVPERAAYLEAGARLFVVTSGGVTADQTVKILDSVRKKLETIAAEKSGPFIYRVTKNGNVDRMD